MHVNIYIYSVCVRLYIQWWANLHLSFTSHQNEQLLVNLSMQFSQDRALGSRGKKATVGTLMANHWETIGLGFDVAVGCGRFWFWCGKYGGCV